MVGPALVFLIIIARCLSAITIRKLWKSQGLLLTGPGNYTVHLGLHSKVVGRESMCGPGVLLLLGSRVEA